ncbi:MAG TPA: BON domain-containing protein [Vicinamibacterales bacterium]|nr:BON domain-containing protein [Vicinamibacterales bacterium]
MKRLVTRAAMILTVATFGLAATASAAQPKEEIRDALLMLPYYGVFDALSVSYDKGTVTLEGYAYHAALKADAARALKRIAGVDDVVDNIKVLPASMNDDELRWRTFFSIYTSSFLSRYAPGAGLLWGHPAGFSRWDMQTGRQPLGNYPIHIVVERGHIRLIGVVDTTADKTAAELVARGVAGSFGVENELVVMPPS